MRVCDASTRYTYVVKNRVLVFIERIVQVYFKISIDNSKKKIIGEIISYLLS